MQILIVFISSICRMMIFKKKLTKYINLIKKIGLTAASFFSLE